MTSNRWLRVLGLLAGLLWLGCTGADDDAVDDDDSAGVEPELETLFAFAVLADPHITADADRAERLQAALDWIDAEAAPRGIELTVVLGDIGWGEDLATARALLDGLSVPYVPIIGDNEIQIDSEVTFDETFTPQYDALSSVLTDWEQAPTPVANPEIGEDSYFQNHAFTHHGVRFIGLDWCVRGDDGPMGETGDLQDFDGGTLPWLESQLAAAADGPLDSVVMLSHLPMQLGMFILEELEVLDAALEPHRGILAVNLAGHVHQDSEGTHDDYYDVYTTDAVWDDEVTVRVITVAGNGVRFTYDHELVVVD